MSSIKPIHQHTPLNLSQTSLKSLKKNEPQQQSPQIKSDSLQLQAKKLGLGALVGGTASAAAQSLSSTIAASGLYFEPVAPTATGAGLGAALGLGISLASIKSDDKSINNAKNLAAGALIGGAAGGMLTAVGSTLFAGTQHGLAHGFAEKIGGPSALGIGIGIAAGVGIAIINQEE